MHKFKFQPDDLFINRLKTYPEYNVFIYQGQMHVNRDTRISGSGGIPVFDVNRNLTGSGDLRVYPFVESGSAKPIFKSQVYQPLLKNFSSDYQFIGEYWSRISGSGKVSSYGNGTVQINGVNAYTSSYGFESPIKRILSQATGSRNHDFFDLTTGLTSSQRISFPIMDVTASALQNIARKYTVLSDHFIFASSSSRSRDLVYDALGNNYILIPSMYYGSSIKKGSVELNYYITGSKARTCSDIYQNGTLIETTCSNGDATGSVVGLVLYDEGIIMLTSSTAFGNDGIEYPNSIGAASSFFNRWRHFGTTLNDGISPSSTLASASYDLNFKGTNYVNTMTMFAHARKGHLNHSNNPTYRSNTLVGSYITGSGKIFAEGSYEINNIVSASYTSASFDKTTYISKVHIYDEDGNLIAITSMAKPIKKTLEDEYTFKMKIDL